MFVNEACGDDKTLLAEVESLLSSLGEASSFMETPAVAEVVDIMEAETKLLKKGQNLAHYQIIEKIGEGGMGAVYLANDTRLARRIALKLLPEKLATDRERMQRFVREARSASALNHPNIITIYEIGESNNTHFISTEYIEGETLREQLKGRPLDFKSSLEIAIQVAGALDAAHRAGIVHRDVKPENVMIRPDGLVKLLDFGIAKLTETQSDADLDPEALTAIKAQTAPGMIIGTAGYMSPEQAQGKIVDARSDIFSFGVMLYEMLAGKPPFEGGNAMETIGAILNKEPVPLSRQTPEVPREIERIINKALRKDREERYQTAKDLLIDLKDGKQDVEFQNKLERTATPDHEEAKTQSLQSATVDIAPHATPSAEYVVGEIKQYKRVFGIGLAILLFAAVGAGVWFLSNSTAHLTNIESIAVMPFVNESGNADTEYLSDGMTETLISSLSQLPHLSVKARNSVFRYKGKDIDPQAVGSELSVQAVLLGRVVQRGDQLTLRLELVDTSNENVIWSEQYNRKQADLVSLQTEIARDVSNKLKTKLSGADEQKVAKSYTENTEAYQLYLKGRFHWNKRRVVDFRKSIEYFQQAIAADPNYALAYAGLASSYALLSQYAGAPPREAIPKARDAAMKALSLDDQLAEAHTAFALVLYNEYDFAGAEREYKRALELNPSDSSARSLYAGILINHSRHEEGLTEARRALEIDPLSVAINSSYGDNLFYARRYDECIEQLKKTLDLDANFATAHASLFNAYRLKGDFAGSVEAFARNQELIGESQNAVLIRESFARGGWKGFLRAMTGDGRPVSFTFYLVATFHTAHGERDQAFAELNRAYESREVFLSRLNVDPRLDPLRNDPRFQDLKRRVGLPP